MPTVTELEARGADAPITMLTAYDAPTAAIADGAGTDALLVGDSMGNAVLGYDTTLPVTLAEVESRTAAVVRATEEALVVADMPFLSYGAETAESVRNAGRLVKDAGADAVKLECGPHTVDLTERLTHLGVPVMAHLGLTPQHVNRLGGYRRQGTTPEAARDLLALARAHEEAGAFSLVLEHVPATVAREVTEALSIPTIGIGAGPDTDGQVLVVNDAVGLSDWAPAFSESFGDVRGELREAIDGYLDAVVSGEFPAPEHTHDDPDLAGFADED
ncbi:MAG: 3-methyl-2-oxobutanoate hydroxymethyltransferase [Halobacteriaceae archaeon]